MCSGSMKVLLVFWVSLICVNKAYANWLLEIGAIK